MYEEIELGPEARRARGLSIQRFSYTDIELTHLPSHGMYRGLVIHYIQRFSYKDYTQVCYLVTQRFSYTE